MPSARNASITEARRAKLLGVDPQHEQVIGVPRAELRTLLRVDAWQACQSLGQVPAVRVARFGLLFQPIELRVEQGALQFAQPIVARDHVMLVPHARRESARSCGSNGTSAASLSSLVVIMPAFATGEILARLERERRQVPQAARGPVL